MSLCAPITWHGQANHHTQHGSHAQLYHTHEDLASRCHTHEDLASQCHTLEDLASRCHTHEDLASPCHTHEDLASPCHTHEDLASPCHTPEDLASPCHTQQQSHCKPSRQVASAPTNQHTHTHKPYTKGRNLAVVGVYKLLPALIATLLLTPQPPPPQYS